ncbi:MAG: HAMP domain-containing histidine kinase [Oscillospiraceae bacterium]|nr:HAMP domain-containing histidine kinase [Oscillospiraceae bacterium]
MANISVLQRNPAASADDQMKWIESTQQAARNMRTMVNELLTLSSVESANTVIHLTAVDFSSAVECSALQMESVAYDRGIVLETHIQEGLWIRADQEYLQRVINSLIENALKYEPDGGSLSVCLTAEKGQAVFAVSNPHSVISQEDLPHIFERFYRANKTRTEDGHGLGLAIAKSMTEAMGGTLSARSSTDAGTCFTLRLRHL